MIPPKLIEFLVEKGGGTIVAGFGGAAAWEGVVLYLHLNGVQGEILEHVNKIGLLGLACLVALVMWLRSKRNAVIAEEAKAIAVEAAATSTMAAEANGVRPPPSAIPEVQAAVTAKRRLSSGVRLR